MIEESHFTPKVEIVTRQSYVVMTYARCGGTFFAQVAGSTGCLGRPEDWFNGKGYHDRGESDYPLDRESQMKTVLSRGASRNGITGLKLSPARLDDLAGFDWHTTMQPSLFIHLTRHDRLGRAISDVIAQQTRQYRSTSPAHGHAKYCRDMILNSIARQALDEGRVRNYFALHDISPLEISYEELSAVPQKIAQRCLAALGMPGIAAIRPDFIELKVQRNNLNEEWRKRFLDESGRPAIMPRLDLGRWKRLRRRSASLFKQVWFNDRFF